MIRRAAIYARYSSALQNDRSIEDQVAVCRTMAERDGLTVVSLFEDRARSGSTVYGRDGLAAMMEAAKSKSFDVLLVESLDRISRDQEDMAGAYKRLTHWGVDLVAVHEGKADQIQVGIRGIVSALYLTDLAHKVRRGAAGNIREGKHAGGLAYGYRTTPGKPGEWTVDEEQAAIVRRIFAEYLAGERGREICRRLNAEGVKPPRGRFWRANTLTGSGARQHGILLNSIYAGRLVWNRVRMVKNPDTGRRVSRVNPETDWQRQDAPHLAIVAAEQFDAAQAIRKERGHAYPTHRKKPRHLLSGLLRCGCCGGGLSSGNANVRRRLYCTNWKESRSCTNGRMYYADEIERRVLTGLQRHLSDPSAIALFLTAYTAERKRLQAEGVTTRADIERRLARATSDLQRAVRVVIESREPIATFDDELQRLNGEKTRLETELAAMAEPVNVVALHPQAVARYLKQVSDLSAMLSAGRPTSESAGVIRALVESITVTPAAKGEPPAVDVQGRLEALIGLDGMARKVVAGTGISLARHLPLYQFRAA